MATILGGRFECQIVRYIKFDKACKEGSFHLNLLWIGSKVPEVMIDFWCLMPLSAIFQLYHGDPF